MIRILAPKRRAVAALTACAVLTTVLAAGGARASATPLGIHIAFGKDPATTMTVVWHTPPGQPGGPAVVEYGETSELGRSAAATTVRAPGVTPSKASYLHETTLSGLTPDTTYHYRVGDGTVWSELYTFHTEKPGDDSFEFVAWGDHGQTPAAQATTAFVQILDPAFVAIAGDVSYANSDIEEWDIWSEQVEALAARTPLMAAPGNHDTQEGTPLAYLARFAYPDGELYYSFDYGRVHFLMLHTTYDATAAAQEFAEQIPFAEADLADAARRKAAGELDFIFVVQHHPLYANQGVTTTSGLTQRNYNPPLIAWQERILQAYDVDVLIVGHNHHYERTYPIIAGQPMSSSKTAYEDPPGYIEVITGGAGAGLYEFKDPNDFASFSAVHAKRFHVMLFEVSGKTLRAKALATDGTEEILDSWTLTS